MIQRLGILIFALTSFSLVSGQEYVKNLGNPGIDDGCTFMEVSGNTIFVAGYSAKDAFISALTIDGDLLWKKYFSFSDNRNFITDIIIQNDHLIFCGYGHDQGTTVFDEFFVNYNYTEHKIEWARKTSLNIKPNNIHYDNGQIVVTGDEYAKGKFGLCFLRLQEKNGRVNDFTTWYYSGHESAAITKIDQGVLYSGGRYGLKPRTDKYRVAISKFEIKDFKHLQSNYFLNSKQDQARAYLADFVFQEDTIISACFSNNQDITNTYSISLLSTLKNGTVNWNYEYKMEGFSSITIRDMVAVEDGYILLGFTKVPLENIILCKFDKEGYPVYSYALGGKYSDKIIVDQGKFLFHDNGYLYLAAQTKNLSDLGDYDSFLIKIKEGDSWNDSCFQAEETRLNMFAYEDLIEGQMTLMEYDTAFKELNIAFKQLNAKTEIDNFKCKKPNTQIEETNPEISFANAAFNNTVFLMDASLSMNTENRMPILKNSLFKILNFMRDEDKISAVSYSDEAKLVLDGISASQASEIRGKIDSLESSGQSDLIAGLRMGIQVAEENYLENSNNRVIITTDGDLSFEKQKDMLNLLSKSKNKNIIFTIFLFNNSSLYYKQLKEIAAQVDANVFVIEPGNIEDVLLNELGAKRK